MNNTEKIHLIDKSFQLQHAGKCDLLLHITSSRMSYAVVDQGQDQLKVLFDSPLKKGSNELKDILEDDSIFRAHFHKVKIASETFKFTFIPSVLYSDKNLQDYAQLVQTDSSDLNITELRTPQIKNITAFNRSLKKQLDERFSDYKLVSSANPLIEAAIKIYGTSGKHLLLNFNPTSFEALLFEGNKLFFYNIFAMETADDFNYFLLLLFQQLEIKPEEVDLIISGEIASGDANYQRIQKYFSKIEFADPGTLLNKSTLFEQVPLHRFFPLISLNLCE